MDVESHVISASCQAHAAEWFLCNYNERKNMRLDEIRKLVTESQPQDWNKIVLSGTASPNYRQTLVTHQSGGNTETVAEGHPYLAVYKDDVDLSLAWGLEEHGYFGEKEKLVFDFSERFANEDVSKFTLDVFWAGNLVDRHVLLSVDGSRAYLPLSQVRVGDGGALEEYFPAEEVPFARLVDGLTNGDGFDESLMTAGLPVLTRDDSKN